MATIGITDTVQDGTMTIVLTVAVPVESVVPGVDVLTPAEKAAVFTLIRDTVAAAKSAYVEGIAAKLAHLNETETTAAVARAEVLRVEG